jgi:hypothetical protein
MKPATLLLIAFAGLAAAEEARPEPGAAGRILRGVGQAPWLGVSVGRLDDAVRAQVPELPAGFGFVVSEVEPGSPADQAGVKAYDLFWKLDDQWIANEAQLFALLRLRQPGERVTLGVYRSGQAMSLPVRLARLPEDQLLARLPESARPVAADTPMKVLKPAERSAEIETADGKAVLVVVDGRAEVRIVASSGVLLYEGPIVGLDGVSRVPDPWKPRVGALERALAHAMKPASPRPRGGELVPGAAE